MPRLLSLLFALLMLAAPVASTAHAASADLFKDAETGVKLKKPAEWVFLSADELIAASGGNAEAAEGMLVTVARHPEPYPDLNPMAQVYHVAMPTTGVLPEAVLDGLVRQIGMGSKVFDVLEPLQETEVSGNPAAVVYVRHNAELPGHTEPVPALSRMWTVVRGTDLFILVFAGPAEGPDVAEDEFKSIFKSLRIKG
ncbi:MAG: hypothetical protein OEY97_06415 [Nitrospirota bacterium]|nr:hypothetical protein [Nitrospirota bacterium]